jgi:hypothetical protein
MTDHLELPNDPDLRGAMDALRRAAKDAHELALRTGTRLIVVEEGELRYIEPRNMGVAEPHVNYPDRS